MNSDEIHRSKLDLDQRDESLSSEENEISIEMRVRKDNGVMKKENVLGSEESKQISLTTEKKTEILKVNAGGLQDYTINGKPILKNPLFRVDIKHLKRKLAIFGEQELPESRKSALKRWKKVRSYCQRLRFCRL